MGNGERIAAYARIRPFNAAELRQDGAKPPCTHPIVDITSERTLTFNPSKLSVLAPVSKYSTARTRIRYDQRYEFDGVFGPESGEAEIYAKVAHPLLETAVAGSNATIFAYGATGCGKSYTVNNINERLADALFAIVRKSRAHTDFVVKVSYLQLYNEKLIDLLPAQQRSPRSTLFLRDTLASSTTHMHIPGLSEYECHSAQDVRELYQRGNENRCIAATQANSVSSRSHALLTFAISRRDRASGARKHATLTIIDLAGSERAQTTQNRGQRLAEGACINRSLLALGNCINARARNSPFVPYRESKLTRLLRFSLEGHCQTAMVVCVSPSLVNFDETHYTLEYAKRASSISGRGPLPRSSAPAPSRIKELEQQVLEMSQWRQRCVRSLCAAFPGLEAAVNANGGWSTISPERLVQTLQKSAIPLSSARIRTLSQPPAKEMSYAAAAARAGARTVSVCTTTASSSSSSTATIELSEVGEVSEVSGFADINSPCSTRRLSGMPSPPTPSLYGMSPIKRVRRD